MTVRLDKVERLRELGENPYANGFSISHTLAQVRKEADEYAAEMSTIDEASPRYQVAGRVMAINQMGKASFVRLRDRSATVDEPNFQIYVRKDRIGDDAYSQFKQMLDLGDIVGAVGPVFRSRRGELSLVVEEFHLLTKSIRPLPDKWAGLTDKETRFRQRYADLIMSLEVRETFRTRAKILQYTRNFFESRDYMEVETPMMQVVAGGATARPFETFHNALGIPLYLRIAPELYLKRLVVGGFERVFELNRNFRNEGMSPKHNPEFTMLEFYQAYATYEDLIELTEELLAGMCQSVRGDSSIAWGEHEISFQRPFARFTVQEALVELGEVPHERTETLDELQSVAKERGVHCEATWSYGKLLVHLFEELCEPKLIQPTFITKYPVAVSPLSRKTDGEPDWVDRFELFIGGNEVANGFSELNDPGDQRQRFEDQMLEREAGDDEAHPIDNDYIRALEYGLPPTAGEGIGIDRLVMLLTGQQSIREVILFPHMRPETNE